MSTPSVPFVLEASADNFASLLRENTSRGLVLLYFWSPKAAPCMLLMPRLVKLAADYGGRFLLILANTETLGQQARAMQVTSVPTVKFLLHGEVVHTLHGAEPDSTFHSALARFLARPEDQARMAALAAHQAGDTGTAITQLARLAAEQPDNLDVITDLCKLMTLSGRSDEALNLLESLPVAARSSSLIAPLHVHLQLIDAAQNGADHARAHLQTNPDDHAARLTCAARALFDGDEDAAMSDLLELARNAADFRDDIGRRALLALFAMLGSEHPLTRRYRAALASLNA